VGAKVRIVDGQSSGETRRAGLRIPNRKPIPVPQHIQLMLSPYNQGPTKQKC
jgi:hypothetical protein